MGAAAKYLPYSQECQAAIRTKVEALIRPACGPFFGNDDLILLVVLGGLAVILAAFWQDIAGFFYEKVVGENPESLSSTRPCPPAPPRARRSVMCLIQKG